MNKYSSNYTIARPDGLTLEPVIKSLLLWSAIAITGMVLLMHLFGLTQLIG